MLQHVCVTVRRFHDNSSTDISSTTLRLQTFRLQTFRLILYTSVHHSYTSNFCFSKSLFSSIPTSTYTMIPFYQSHFYLGRIPCINPGSIDIVFVLSLQLLFQQGKS